MTRKHRRMFALLGGGPLMARQVYAAHEGEAQSTVYARLLKMRAEGWLDRATQAGGTQWGLTHAGYVVVRAMSLAQAELTRRDGEGWADVEPTPEVHAPITPAFVPGSRPQFDRTGRLIGYVTLDERPDLG